MRIQNGGYVRRAAALERRIARARKARKQWIDAELARQSAKARNVPTRKHDHEQV